jgi:hypothetical protein
MLNAGHDLSFGRAVAGQLDGNRVLDQNIEHDPGLVHGAPLPVLRTGDLEHDLVQMPSVANSRHGSGCRTAGRICAPTARTVS